MPGYDAMKWGLLLGASSLLAGCGSTPSASVPWDDLRLMPAVQPVVPEAQARESVPDWSSTLREPLSVTQAVEIALSNQHALRVQMRDLEVARAALRSAALPTNPEAHIEFEHDQFGQHRPHIELMFDARDLVLVPLRRLAARDAWDAAQADAASRLLRFVSQLD